MNRYKITFTGSAIVSADNEVEAERKFSNEEFFDLQTDVQHIAAMEEQNEHSDLIKALKCLASQDADGNCYMDHYNFSILGNPNRLKMRCGEFEGSICCPYNQSKYGVCFEDAECSGFLYEAANILEKLGEVK